MRLTPYLTFDGNAREALSYYAAVFGVEPEMVMGFGDMPEQPDWVTEANRQRLAHARLNIGAAQLMMSDTAGLEPFMGHSGHAVNVMVAETAEAQRVFDALAEGGEVKMAFAPTFWSKGFGNCRDRFGVSWMVNVE